MLKRGTRALDLVLCTRATSKSSYIILAFFCFFCATVECNFLSNFFFAQFFGNFLRTFLCNFLRNFCAIFLRNFLCKLFAQFFAQIFAQVAPMKRLNSRDLK